MTGLKLKVITGIASVAAVAAFSAAPVHADTAVAGAIVFSGTTQNLTPVQLVGGSGTYGFSSAQASPQGLPGFCAAAGVDSGPSVYAGVSIDPRGSGCSTNAGGSYANVVCGTGTTGSTTLGVAEGDSATITASEIVPAGATLTETFSYGIVFAAGVGVIHSLSAPGAGVVEIAPTGGSCATGVTAFTATGAAVLG